MNQHDAIAERIRRLRKGMRLTQQDMADALGVAKSTYSSWENGRPTLDALFLLCDRFGTTPARTLFGEPPPPPPRSPLTTEEESLLLAYRSANPEGQRDILRAALGAHFEATKNIG